MCGVPAVMAGVGIAGAGMQAYGQYQAGQASASAARYNQALMERNAEELERTARLTREHGAMEAERLMQEGAGFVGAGRVAFAAGGVDVSTGAPNIWEASTQREITRDAEMVRMGAEQDARGLEFGAADTRARGRLARAEGRFARRAGYIGAVSSLLGGATQASSSYYQWNRPRG